MIRYDNIRYDPPAPIIDTTLTKPYSSESKQIPGLIDTGADCMAIPMNIINDLNLQPFSECEVFDYNGNYVGTETTYNINLSLGNINFDLIEVIPPENEEEVIIGRNILNELTILLKGKEQTFEITKP